MTDGLTADQKKAFDEAIQQLKASGTKYDAWEVRNLIEEGYSPEQIVEILKRRNALGRYLYNHGQKNYTKQQPLAYAQELYNSDGSLNPNAITEEQLLALYQAKQTLDGDKGNLLPYTDRQLEQLAKQGLTGIEMTQAVLAGLPLTDDAATIRQRLQELNSRIDTSQGGPNDPVSPHEMQMAYQLAAQGNRVIFHPENAPGLTGKRGDATIQPLDGSPPYEAEFKTLSNTGLQPANQLESTLKETLKGGGTQADHFFIDGRGTNLTPQDARTVVEDMWKRLASHGVKEVTVYVDGSVITVP